MSESKYPEPVTDHLLFSLQFAVWAAVLGCVVLAVDTPQLVATPADANVSATAPAAAAPAPNPSVDYFPAQFPAPRGEPAPQPAAF
ncbi:MAG: hypothetical protein ABI981_14075 [Betaproteobacteria bacterium]